MSSSTPPIDPNENNIAELLGYLESDSDDEDHSEFMEKALKVWVDHVVGETGQTSQPRTRTYIPRDRVGAEASLMQDYFADNPTYPANLFRRRFRMSKELFLRIVGDICSCSIDPLPEYFRYFHQRPDCTGNLGFTAIQKCTSAIRQMAYGSAPDAFDEYLKMGERTAADCLDNFCKCVRRLYHHHYLRKPNADDIQRLYTRHEEIHGFPGMLGSIDCMHWQWERCPTAWQGHYTRGDQGCPTVMLEAVASYDLWIWHSFFGTAGSNNDINVLQRSPVFDDIIAGTAPEAAFHVNGHQYTKGYYLADGIYPEWATFVKTFSCPQDEKGKKFKLYQEKARKDIERAFGVLQGRFAILRRPARMMIFNKLRRVVDACIILHNMIIEDSGFAISPQDDGIVPEIPPDTRTTAERFVAQTRNMESVRDRQTHHALRADLVEHIWNLP